MVLLHYRGEIVSTGVQTDAPNDANYLIGTANSGLTAEIVVGTAPGGELGNTWASPTVDSTHSGSAHHADAHTVVSHSDTSITGAELTQLSGISANVTDTNLNALTLGSGTTTLHGHAGGGKLELIGTADASSSASLTITGLDNTYDTYLITLVDMVPASNGANIGFQIGDSSGIDTGGSDYGYHTQNLSDISSSYSAAVAESSGRILLPGDGIGNSGTTGSGAGHVIWFYRSSNGTTKPLFSGHGTVVVSGGRITGGAFMAERTAIITVDRILCKMDTGNIATGRMTIWGVAHA
jgi:hypothetical protein